MRSGELKLLKDELEHNFVKQLISRLVSSGCKRRNYSLFASLLTKFTRSNLQQEGSVSYVTIASIVDQLVLRLTMLETTQRGKKITIPLPTTRKLAVSVFISDLVKLVRKDSTKHKDTPNFLFNVLVDAKNKKGTLYNNKKEAYKLAKQNAYAVRRIYTNQLNKSAKNKN